MNGFLHNPVADLYGPYFLVFYALAIVAMIVAARRSLRRLDRSLDQGPSEIPSKLDPYEVAYLRGGENEVTRVAIASLIRRGFLRIVEEKTPKTTTRTIDRGEQPGRVEVTPVEAAVWAWTGYPAEPGRIFVSGGLSSRVKEMCVPYERELAEKGLLAPQAEMKSMARWLWSFGFAAMILLGSYKLIVANAKGHSNVWFLYGLMVIGGIAYTIACRTLPWVSARGKAYLKDLKLVYEGLKEQADSAESWAVPRRETDGARVKPPAATADSDCLLLLGVFGIPVLMGTPFADLGTIFTRGATVDAGGGCGSGGGCGGGGGGCGGGGGGCGGGCGGCGG